ncbi:MAG: RNA-binding protein [Ignavibacteria bacterium]|nr:RNA-binding protein [Ignavibacteria bacterium]MBI3766556.1 RNA-binding protein [Ignavibacteriales bacterium]
MQILVVNIPPEFTDTELKSMFEEFGTVLSAKIGKDKKTGAPEGYGIVEMPVKHEARASVDALRGKEMQGKPLRVRILKPDDPFHSATKPGRDGMSGSRQFRGDGGNRGSGVLRRGGQRGS